MLPLHQTRVKTVDKQDYSQLAIKSQAFFQQKTSFVAGWAVRGSIVNRLPDNKINSSFLIYLSALSALYRTIWAWDDAPYRRRPPE